MGKMVRGGTPDHGVNLCDTCRHARRIVGMTLGEHLVRCTADGEAAVVTIPFRVSGCDGYSDKRVPFTYELERMAWRYVTSEQRFLTPDEVDRVRHRRSQEEGRWRRLWRWWRRE